MKVYREKDVSIHYVDRGEGNPLFFIHGLGADHCMFEPQIDFFSKAYRVICPDLRGNGESSKLTGPVRTVLDRQCDDIAHMMDALHIDRAVFAGVSYGGVFCFHFALRYPERVAGMIVTDSFSDTRIIGVKELGIMISIYMSLPFFYLPKLLKASVLSQYKRWPLAQKHMYRAFEKLRSHEVVLQRLAINKANYTPDLDTIRCPVLGLVGDDVKLMIKYMRRAMDRVKGSEFIVLEDSFDPSNLCAVDRYNELTTKFLKENGW